MTTEAASGHNQPRRIALIGFGEVGTRFAEGLIASGRHDVAAYDILFDDRREAPRLRAKARELKVEACASPAAAIAGARIVISAVTASSAQEAAHEAAKHMGPGQFFLDINSVSPETKRAH